MKLEQVCPCFILRRSSHQNAIIEADSLHSVPFALFRCKGMHLTRTVHQQENARGRGLTLCRTTRFAGVLAMQDAGNRSQCATHVARGEDGIRGMLQICEQQYKRLEQVFNAD